MITQFDDLEECEDLEYVEEKLVKTQEHCDSINKSMQKIMKMLDRMSESLEGIGKRTSKRTVRSDSVEKDNPDLYSKPDLVQKEKNRGNAKRIQSILNFKREDYDEEENDKELQREITGERSSDRLFTNNDKNWTRIAVDIKPDREEKCSQLNPDPETNLNPQSDQNPNLKLHPIPDPYPYPNPNPGPVLKKVAKSSPNLNPKLHVNPESEIVDEEAMEGDYVDDENHMDKELLIEFARDKFSDYLFDISGENVTEISIADKPDPDPPDSSILISFPLLAGETVGNLSDYLAFRFPTYERQGQARSSSYLAHLLAQVNIGPTDSKYLVTCSFLNLTHASQPCFSFCQLIEDTIKNYNCQDIGVTSIVWSRYVQTKFPLNWQDDMKGGERKFQLIYGEIIDIPSNWDIIGYEGFHFRGIVKSEGPIGRKILSRTSPLRRISKEVLRSGLARGISFVVMTEVILMSLVIDRVLTEFLEYGSRGYVSMLARSTLGYVNLESAQEDQNIIGLAVSYIKGILVFLEDVDFFHRTSAACFDIETVKGIKNKAGILGLFSRPKEDLIWQVGVDDRCIFSVRNTKRSAGDSCEQFSLLMDAFNSDDLWSCLIHSRWRASKLPNRHQTIVYGIVSYTGKGNIVECRSRNQWRTLLINGGGRMIIPRWYIRTPMIHCTFESLVKPLKAKVTLLVPVSKEKGGLLIDQSEVGRKNNDNWFLGSTNTSFLQHGLKLVWTGLFFLEPNWEDYVMATKQFILFFFRDLTLEGKGSCLATSHRFSFPRAWLREDLQKPLSPPLPSPLPSPPAAVVDIMLLNQHFHFFPP